MTVASTAEATRNSEPMSSSWAFRTTSPPGIPRRARSRSAPPAARRASRPSCSCLWRGNTAASSALSDSASMSSGLAAVPSACARSRVSIAMSSLAAASPASARMRNDCQTATASSSRPARTSSPPSTLCNDGGVRRGWPSCARRRAIRAGSSSTWARTAGSANIAVRSGSAVTAPQRRQAAGPPLADARSGARHPAHTNARVGGADRYSIAPIVAALALRKRERRATSTAGRIRSRCTSRAAAPRRPHGASSGRPPRSAARARATG